MNSHLIRIQLTILLIGAGLLISTQAVQATVGYYHVYVNSLAIQSNGKILAAGRIEATHTSQGFLVSLYSDGTLDRLLLLSTLHSVNKFAIQPDGKILVAIGIHPGLTQLNQTRLLRLYPNGRIDSSFNAEPYLARTLVLDVQPDGKILIGGFANYGGPPYRNNPKCGNAFYRLKADGSIDETFKTVVKRCVNDIIYVNDLAIQSDGKIIIAGQFTVINQQPCPNICRLNKDGGLDMSFNAFTNGRVARIAIQPDDKILITGNYTQITGKPRQSVDSLNLDGTLDSSFKPSSKGNVISMDVRPDGKALVGWDSKGVWVYDNDEKSLGRLNPDGSDDINFKKSTSHIVKTIAVQADNKILVGMHVLGLVRLNPDGGIDKSFRSLRETFSSLRDMFYRPFDQ